MTAKSGRFRFIFLFIFAVGIYTGLYFIIVAPFTLPVSIYNTPAIRDISRINMGYTLIAPYNNALNSNPQNKGDVYLLDMLGREVHTWQTRKQVLSARLTPRGNLIVAMEPSKLSTIYPGGGNTGDIQELDWKGNVVREYVNESLHHDFTLLPNGNIAVVSWEKLPASIARNVKGGVAGTELKGDIWSDAILELDSDNNIVWTWHAHDHMNTNVDIIDPALPRTGWTYINGIRYLPNNPIDNEEGYLLSMRSINTVMIVRKRDGEIIWRSPRNLTNTQHDPNIMPNGDILVFDNGFTRLPIPAPIYGSRVITIDPKTGNITWSFDGGPGVMDKLAFYGPLVGGSQPLPNGNILITDGPKGHIFEVTPDKKIVWDLVSPYKTKSSGAFPINFIFKARRYSADEIDFPPEIAKPLDATLYRMASVLAPLYFKSL